MSTLYYKSKKKNIVLGIQLIKKICTSIHCFIYYMYQLRKAINDETFLIGGNIYYLLDSILKFYT